MIVFYIKLKGADITATKDKIAEVRIAPNIETDNSSSILQQIFRK